MPLRERFLRHRFSSRRRRRNARIFENARKSSSGPSLGRASCSRRERGNRPANAVVTLALLPDAAVSSLSRLLRGARGPSRSGCALRVTGASPRSPCGCGQRRADADRAARRATPHARVDRASALFPKVQLGDTDQIQRVGGVLGDVQLRYELEHLLRDRRGRQRVVRIQPDLVSAPLTLKQLPSSSAKRT